MEILNNCKILANAGVTNYYECLNDIKLCEELHKFENKGVFDPEFLLELNWLLEVWLDDEAIELFDAVKVADIEDKLERIPFEQSIRYKEPANYEFANICLSEPAEWRTDVASVMTMSKEDKTRIFGYFEYMCYYVINARNELLFDIQARLGVDT